MSEKDIRNLVLLGLGAFAVYYFVLRPRAAAAPVALLPGPVQVTGQIVGTGIPSQQATVQDQTWTPGPAGFPAPGDQFPHLTEEQIWQSQQYE